MGDVVDKLSMKSAIFDHKMTLVIVSCWEVKYVLNWSNKNLINFFKIKKSLRIKNALRKLLKIAPSL
jgi:hypothetical protein